VVTTSKRGFDMAAKKKLPQSFNLGDRVKIKYFPALRARIGELRGPLGPGGAQVYRVRIQHKPKPYFNELTADLLEAIPTSLPGTP
jgi:hypothetical protein